MKIVAIIQARVGSTRFPRKVFADLSGKPFIWHVVNRLKFVSKIDNIVLATTTNSLDDELEEWAKSQDLVFYRGSENNVLERFYFAAKENDADVIVRITADDPFKDPNIIENVIDLLLLKEVDFVYNNNPPSFPEGLDTEVFTFKSLEKAYNQSKSDFEKEHVTQYFYRHPEIFSQYNLTNIENLSYLRWTVDTLEDYTFAKVIYEKLYKQDHVFFMDEILDLIKSNPDIVSINSKVERSSMYKNL